MIQTTFTTIRRDTVIGYYNRVVEEALNVADFEVASTGESAGGVYRLPIVARYPPKF